MQRSALGLVRCLLPGTRRSLLVGGARGVSSKAIKHPDFAEEFKGRENDDNFPCLVKLKKEGPVTITGVYGEDLTGYRVYKRDQKFTFKHGGVIPRLELAYETWGELNEEKTNAVLLHTGLSGSSHAKSHKGNTSHGWWEKFIGPGRPIDTNKFFVICSNLIGGCYGSTGPSSINPTTGQQYAMAFPLVAVEDMISCQFLLVDSLGIDRLHATIGSSLGGMQSIMAAALFPQRVGRVVSISACVQTHPSSIALRYVQRRILMSDPKWSNGNYYGKTFPRMGMQHAREIGTITYRSGPEWKQRFGNIRADTTKPPDFCPDFLIETYLDRQGEKFSTSYDPNSLLYISKAMDMFDMSCDGSLESGVARVKCPVLVLGVNSDILFPVEQQREMAALLKQSGNDKTTFYELNSIYGHDTFLLDVSNVGMALKGYLESQVNGTSM